MGEEEPRSAKTASTTTEVKMDKLALLNQIRYSERLCQRTARLYRRLSAAFLFLGITGGSAVLANIKPILPDWVSIAGGALMAVFVALNIVIRPTEKAVANEIDAKRYARLRTEAASMSFTELSAAIDKARESDTQEVEPLRDVAFNDVVTEYGRADAVVPLSTQQRILKAVA